MNWGPHETYIISNNQSRVIIRELDNPHLNVGIFDNFVSGRENRPSSSPLTSGIGPEALVVSVSQRGV